MLWLLPSPILQAAHGCERHHSLRAPFFRVRIGARINPINGVFSDDGVDHEIESQRATVKV
jgi:hypothetical protein